MTSATDIRKESDIRFFSDRAFSYSFFVIILSLFYYLSYARYGVIEGDWGMLSVGAERFLQGKIFYKDFSILYTPGIYLYTAIFFKLFGISLSSAVIGWSVLRAFNCLIIYLIGTEVVSRRTALVLPLALWFVPAVLHKSFFVFFVLLDIFILIKMLSSENRLFYFIAGITASITLLFRVDLFGFFIIATVIVQSMRVIMQTAKIAALSEAFKKMFFLCCGIGTGVIPQAYYLFAKSAAAEAYRQTFSYSDAMKSLLFELPPLSQLLSLNTLAVYKYAGILTPLAVYSLICLMLVLLLIAKDFKHENDKKMIVVLLFGGMTLNQSFMYPSIARVVMILSPVLIINIYLIARYFKLTSNDHTIHKIIYKVSLGGLNSILILFAAFTCSSADVYINGSIFARFANSEFISDSRMNVYSNYDYAETFNKVSENLKSLTEENEYIFTFPGSYQLFHFVTGRKPLEKYALIGEYLNSEKRQKEVIRLLEEKNVRVILSELKLDVRKRERWAPRLNEYIMKHYESRHDVGPFSILVRKT